MVNSLTESTRGWRHYCVFLFLLILSGTRFPLHAQNDRIRLNQLGFYRYGPKTAVTVAAETWYFSIKSPDLSITYYSGELSPDTLWKFSEEHLKVADFSRFTRPGTYVVYVKDIGPSYPFTIAENTFEDVTRGLIRAFYFQRASTSLDVQYAGTWSRKAGHDDTHVTIHPSAASDPTRPGARVSGAVYPSPKGWYDAGDYGKYIVNAGITTYQLLLLYEQFADYFNQFSLNIPESLDTIPDLLNEVKWELDWLLTMQDPVDGGVYHKLTAKGFIGDVMPADADANRFFIGKGAAATFDFTALCAMAYRIYQPFLPSFADSCLTAARYAWEWGTAHPDSAFRNPDDIVTGEYGDRRMGDEKFWAASELFLATGDSTYRSDDAMNYTVPSWPTVGMLGCYSLALAKGDTLARAKIIKEADALLKRTTTTPYRTSVNNEFYWGSNGVVANQGMIMLVAYLLTKECDYLEGAVHSCDYLLGRNATGYSFITGFGSKPARHPHHRPSTSDGIDPPVPGFLVGGPNSSTGNRNGENCPETYPTPRAKAWIDNSCSFSSNEVAINWNAPAAFLTGGISAIFSTPGFDLSPLEKKYAVDNLPPSLDRFVVENIYADRATVVWKTTEPAAVTIACRNNLHLLSPKRIHHPVADSGSLTVTGLDPATVYFLTCTMIDRNGNITVHSDRITTAVSTLYDVSFTINTSGTRTAGSEITFTFSLPENSNALFHWTPGGSSIPAILPITRPADGNCSVSLLPEDYTVNGLSYFLTISNETDTLTTPVCSIVPDSISITRYPLCRVEAYHLLSLPGIFTPIPSENAPGLSGSDAAGWRYFSYQCSTGTYTPSAAFATAAGGWFFSRDSVNFTHRAGGIPPDTLFPIVLAEGWNCIGNPFPYPVYWDNCMIDYQGALIGMTDSIVSLFARRQLFAYSDSTPNRINDGAYCSNRELTSHLYNSDWRLAPWEAYWVYAENSATTLLINPSQQYPDSPVLAKAARKTPHSWFYDIRISSGTSGEQVVAIGASERADNGYDEFDTPAPPALSSGIQAWFDHPGWHSRQQHFASDIIRLATPDATCDWILDIYTTGSHPVSVRWSPVGDHDGSVSLHDPKAGATVAMEQTTTYIFTPDQSEEKRSLLFSWSPIGGGMPATPQKWDFSLKTASPYRFFYSIPSGASGGNAVSIDILTIQGRKINTLINKNHLPGTYRISWDGATSDGRRVSPGLYIAHLHSQSFSRSILLHHSR